MIELFIKDLEEVYENIKNRRNKYYIDEFKKKWGINESIGQIYEEMLIEKSRKKKGSFYTPKDVYNYINTNVVDRIKVNKDFNIKILDPSCGGGYFLIDIYNKINSLLERENFKNREKHIIENIIYGNDLDKTAVIITIIELFYISGHISENIVCRDFLLEEDKNTYNYIVGNPPYIGHKVLDSDYRKKISSIYKDVFYEKGDLNYCFFKKAIEMLTESGNLIFFTSRYILESLYGEGIRDYILKNANLESVVDFYGTRVVKGAGIDTVILFINKNTLGKNIEYFKINIEGKDKGSKVFYDISLKTEKYTKYISVDKNSLLKSGWSFLSDIEKSIIKKIQDKCTLTLSDIGESFQGIITGKDEAFIITKEEAELLGIEEDLLKPWIKGRQIEKFKVSSSNQLIIYSDIIDSEEKYENTINHLLKYKEKLEKRRECLRGVRKWYGIQWGRKEENFKGKKIIFPYKSSSNRFAIDRENYFSADIYSIKIKKEYENYTYEFLESLLNSSLYEFYIKSISKKLGENLYEYYPNKIMKILIPNIIKEIEEVYFGEKTNVNNVDKILNEYFDISYEEFKVIKLWK